MKFCTTILMILTVLSVIDINGQERVLVNNITDFKAGIEKVGLGLCVLENGTLSSKDAYASVGSKEWQNYKFTFQARTPISEKQVQIWFGFREQGRNKRYVVGFKGGCQNDIEIARMGLMGDDAFLGIRNLDFEPKVGVWYNFTVEVCKNRIRVFINNELLPRIDVIDRNADLLPAGSIALGGAWITAEFRKLKVVELPENYFNDIKHAEYSYYLTKKEKEQERQTQRKQFEGIKITNINNLRTEISLNGNWLFKPGYEISNDNIGFNRKENDENWHLIDVPNFWNPSRIWLHGETFMEEGFPKGVSDTYFQKETDRCENYTFDYKKTKIGWYRQWIELPDAIADKNFELVFEAVSKVAEVYVNGIKAGSNSGMFGAFNVNITKLVNPGENLIAVKVMKDYVDDISDANEIATIAVTVEVTNQMLKDLPHGFYRDNPAGIWQPVTLLITEPVKIEDVYIKPLLTGADIEVTIRNNGTEKRTFCVQTKIDDVEDKNNLFNGESLSKLELNANEEKVFTFNIYNIKPKLWSPEEPNLYDFTFTIHDNKNKTLIDQKVIRSGFRTFEAKGNYFYLNGNRYWLRGANHTPHALGINNVQLAEKTFELYHNGNIMVTRSHTIPYSKVWLEAADKKGVGVSFEGTWPWLMIGVGENSIPTEDLLNIWSEEWLRLIKKYRNHPSLFYWTINNEMNFTHNADDVERIETKMGIVSDVVKQMRKVDPTRPICFDSGYTRKQVKHKHDSTFFEKFDDGDIDDGHNYSGWYHSSIFDNFKSTPFLDRKTEGRPLITQEWSTGYPNTETGHHTRSYLWQHQNTQTHVGNQAYPFGNPKYSLENNAFLTSELVEAVRRTHATLAGMHNFSSITWFQNVYDAERVKPYPTYYRMKNSLNPVLISAELWGRHFYAGEKLAVNFCVVNDKVDGQTLEPTMLKWAITYKDNRVISSGTYEIPEVKHYSREWLEPNIILPDAFEGERLDGKLQLFLYKDGREIAKNDYGLMIAKKQWLAIEKLNNSNIVLIDYNEQTKETFDMLNVKYASESSIEKAFAKSADVYVVSGLKDVVIGNKELEIIHAEIKKGAKVLFINTGAKIKEMFPEYFVGYVNKSLETSHIDIPESDIFADIEFMDLRYFNNNRSNKPLVYSGLMQINESNKNITPLASGCEHRYARIKDRRKEMLTMKGFPIVSIRDEGEMLFSEMMTDKGKYDPIAGKLLCNMIIHLIKK